jgi:type I restriction-modification system DNA methylase subunit
MGIQKECSICKNTFVSRTIKSARWERKCPECYGKSKQTTAAEKVQKQHLYNDASMRKDIEKLYAKVSDIDVLISAEISNTLASLSDNQLFDKIHQQMEQTLNEKLKEINEENDKFKTKIQSQLISLNNKIVKIMQEMKEND